MQIAAIQASIEGLKNDGASVRICQVNNDVVCHNAILSDELSDQSGAAAEMTAQKQQTLGDALRDRNAIGMHNADGSHDMALQVKQA
jgi:hypothetical protein